MECLQLPGTECIMETCMETWVVACFKEVSLLKMFLRNTKFS